MAENIGYGQQAPQDTTDQYAVINFIVRQMLAKLSTMKLVKIEAVHLGDGDPPWGGTVDVHPLVNQVDGNNNATPHGTVYGIPWFRLRAGPWAIIADPAAGDVGFVVVSDRDISSVKANNGQEANPGSNRKWDLADGVYLGGINGMGDEPSAFVELRDDGTLKMVDGSGNVLETTGDGFELTGNVRVVGDLAVTGEVKALADAAFVTLSQHLHTSAAAGNPTSTPTPGT